MKKKKLIVIGNQIDISNDYSNFVNNSDYVIRFNKLESFNKNTGTKINELVCRYANAFQIIHGFNENSEYINKNINFKNIKLTIVLNNFNDTKGLILANRICEKNNILNFNIIYNNLNNSYNNLGNTTLASTGKVLLEFILKNNLYKNFDIYLLGFNWFNLYEDNGHLWSIERKQIEKYGKENKIIILK